MKYNLFVDAWEIRKQLRLSSDSRVDQYAFTKAAEQASADILNVLRTRYDVEAFDITNFTDSAISGVATSGSANVLTLSTGTWTINEFTKSSGSAPVGFDCEIIMINGTTAAYVADIVSNTATAITFSSIDWTDITPAVGWKFYIRQKCSGLNDIGIKLGVFNYLNSNQGARSLQDVSAIAKGDKDQAYVMLNDFYKGVREPLEIRKSDSVTLNGSEWQRLSKGNIDPSRLSVTYNSTVYPPERGYQIEYYNGMIRWASSVYTSNIPSNGAITVAYYYSPRIVTVGACG